MGESTSARPNPAAVRLGSQTGMKPPFTRIATALSPIPTSARLMPGRARFAQSPAASTP